MKTKYFALALVPALALTLAPSLTQAAWYDKTDWSDQRKAFVSTINYSVTPLSNGYQLQLSSDNNDTLTQLQTYGDVRQNRARPRVDKTVNNTENGITVTKTTNSTRLGNRLERRATYPKAALSQASQR